MPHFERLRRMLTVAMLVMVTSAVDVWAQSAGTVSRTHWPDVLYETQAGAMDRPGSAAMEDFADVAFVPFLDSLVLEYAAPADTPEINLILRWVPGEGGVIDGELVDEMPEDLELNLIDLQATLRSQGQDVGVLLIALDSLRLPARDFEHAITLEDSWAALLENASSETTRAAFAAGFTLEDLTILRVEFIAPPEALTEVPVTRRQPRGRTIFVPERGIWIGWDLGPDPYRRGGRARYPNRRPRGETGRVSSPPNDRTVRGGRTSPGETRDTDRAGAGVSDQGDTGRSGTGVSGQGDTGRSGTGVSDQGSSGVTDSGNGERKRGRSRGLPAPKRGDNDDDDDRDLLGPALGAAAAVGALAYFGGTIGYFGYPSDAPVGIEAGRITESGGALIHAAISTDVATGGGDERLVVGISGVFRRMAGGLQPMAGVDVWLSEDGDAVDAVPVVTAGVLLNISKPVSVHLGTDLSDFRPRFGLAFSFR